jgi:hypothetical protein
MQKPSNSLDGISEKEQSTMLALLKMQPQDQKSAPKRETPKGVAQRQRRKRETTRKANSSD